MAYQRFCLRPLRLTHRTTDDMTECVDVHRGLIPSEDIQGSNKSLLPEIDVDQDDDDTDAYSGVHSGTGVSSMELEEPTSYEIECKASVAAWEEIRPSILQAVTESHAMQIDQECLNCDKSATLRCSGCGPVAFYCEGCFSDLHKSQNTFHIAEKWDVS